jgi:hypothetical protein
MSKKTIYPLVELLRLYKEERGLFKMGKIREKPDFSPWTYLCVLGWYKKLTLN